MQGRVQLLCYTLVHEIEMDEDVVVVQKHCKLLSVNIISFKERTPQHQKDCQNKKNKKAKLLMDNQKTHSLT